ncbi:MAG: 30S ribosomal protein S4e [Conexivisphaerales archaeon]
MGRKSGSNRLKREAAPRFYSVPRKSYPFLTLQSPGPHPRSMSYDPITILRDLLAVARTKKEAEYVVKSGKFVVDGKARTSIKFPVGLMDVLEFKGTETAFRMLPWKGSPIHPFAIPQSEKNVKLCRITSKVTVKGGKIQIGTHDGRTFIVEDGTKFAVGDTILLDLNEGTVKSTIPLKKGVLALITGGKRLGKIGEVVEVNKGRFSSKPSVRLSLPEGEVILPRELIIAVGTDKPLITLPGGV